MSGGGGKGGSESTQTQIPAWLEDASKDVVSRGNAVGDIGYTPYMGPEIAAFNKAQESAFNNNIAMARDLGLEASSTPSMPGAEHFGNGVWGYGSYEPFKATMERFREERPGQSAMIDSFFIDPVTGEAGDLTTRMITEARQMMESGQPLTAGGGYGPDGNEGPTGSGTSGAGLFGGYSGIGDMMDGGGAGRSGSSYQGGGAISAIGNARNDISQAITGRSPLGGNDGGGGGGKGGR